MARTTRIPIALAAAFLSCELSDAGTCLDLGGSYDHQFAECDREQNHPGPNSACLHDLPGAWTVVGHFVPGISAMSPAEADAWNGSVLSLAKDRFGFRDHVCSSPTYETREIDRPKFEEEFRVTWTALGLANQPVCVTEVSCPGDGPNPGSLLVHGRGELLALWDGVYFRLSRR